MDGKSERKIKLGKENYILPLAPAPAAGGSFFKYDNSSSSSSSSPSLSPTDHGSVLAQIGGASGGDFGSAKDLTPPAPDLLKLESSDHNDASDDEISMFDDSGEKEILEERPSMSVSSKKNLEPRPGSSTSSEDAQIIQTKEEFITKEERDRSKRFDYLLKQAEIWGHFMQPAYNEALQFSEDTTSQRTADGLSDSQSSKQEGLQVPSNKSRKKKPRIAIPDATAASPSLNESSGRTPKYITHFDASPSFIQGGVMRDYQVRGLNWMISLYEKGLSGILADEMGLGKTIQAISLLGYMKHYRGIDGPHLIIAPKSTLPNWMNELEKWCPTLKAICLIGSKEERPSFIKQKFLPKRWNVCVTSYEMARIERSTLARVNYHYIIVDEAQKIKNENSLLATYVRRFHSSVRLLLTGTPLQNNLHELWALLNFLLPDVFYSSEDFDSWFNESNCMGNQNLVDRLHSVLRPFLLRRIKADVEKSLPPKSEMRIYVEMTPMQREWYRKILLNDIEVITGDAGKTSKKALHNVIMHLRKVCNHPYLFEGAEPQPFTTDSHLVTNSGKMIVLDKLLKVVKAQNSRVLLFSQFTMMLDIIEDYCIWREYDYCRLDGSTDYDVRQEDIEEFNSPNSKKFIYLLSTRAGGLGINLASANIVIIYDSDWNPTVDTQAMDRAHRIGQTKEVKVFRFVCQDTAEEKIVERAAAKLHLDKMVIQQGRLVGVDGKKLPNTSEMMSVVRFGAEKILSSGNKEGISDADIDTILAQSKLRSEELDRRLNGMNEGNLRELTIEQVELNWAKKPAENDNSVFNFEGQNYRELRKRKTDHHEENARLMLEGKRRKDMNLSKANSDDDTPKSTSPVDSDTSFVMIDDESIDSNTDENRMQDLVKSQIKKPVPMHDYHFCPLYTWELYWRKVDYFRKISTDFVLQHLPEELSLQEIQSLTASEIGRLEKCGELNGVERREIRILKNEGFTSWKKKDYKQFLEAMHANGPDNLMAVAKAVKGKEVEEVVRYSQVFWLRCHELANFEEVMAKVNRSDLIAERRARQQKLLNKKINDAKSVADVVIKYDPYHWRGQRFSAEDDAQLLICISEIGLLTADVFNVLRFKLLDTKSDTCSAFLRTRSKEELRDRFNLLMHMIEKESGIQTEESQPDEATIESKPNMPVVQALSQKSEVQIPKTDSPKLKKVHAAKKSKPASSTSQDT